MFQKEYPFFTIIVPTFNRYQLLRQCAASLAHLEYPEDRHKIIIVDDGSDDETRSWALQGGLSGLRCQYVRLEENQGVAAARNRGLNLAEGDFVAFLDDDCTVEGGWLKLVVKTFQSFPGAGAVGGSILNPQDDPVAWASYILEFSMWFPGGAARPMRDMPGCNIVYCRSAIAGMSFQDIGKDTVYEDSLFNHQLRMRGREIIFAPRIQVRHYRVKDRCGKEGFLKSQQRYGLGFIRGGYRVHGVWGRLLLRLSFFNLVCPRLFLVWGRCCRSWTLFTKFFSCFRLIVAGEWERNKVIYLKGKYPRP